MQAKKDQDNVIHFPGRRTETVATLQPQIEARPQNLKFIAGLGAVIVLSLFANRYTPENSLDLSSQSGGRGIASVSDRSILPEERDQNWEKSLAQELSQRHKRDLASLTLGQRPSAEERLRFGILKSQYAIIMENGKLSEIRTPTNEATVYIGDTAQFLVQNQSLMPVEFSTASSEARQVNKDGINQSFVLLDGNQKQVGVANFDMDRYGRLLKFNVTRSTSVE